MSIKISPNVLSATVVLAVSLSGCSPKVVIDKAGGGIQVDTGLMPGMPVLDGAVQAMPRAVVYRMSGDCADLVPVTLTADGKRVASYPAPTDLNEGQRPVALGDGWWLDRRGIGPYSVFTDYTYEEYEKLGQAPSADELMKHMAGECKVTRIMYLPVTASQAAADPSVAKAYVANGFKDCEEAVPVAPARMKK